MAGWERSCCCGREQEQTLAADHGIDLLACDRGEEAVRQAGGLHEITRLDYEAHCGVDRAGIGVDFFFAEPSISGFCINSRDVECAAITALKIWEGTSRQSLPKQCDWDPCSPVWRFTSFASRHRAV